MNRKSIALIHPDKAFMPEIAAYEAYLSKKGFQVKVFTKKSPEALADYYIHWHFMGLDNGRGVKGKYFKIHEYVSLSTPPLKWLKDMIKKHTNVKPDLRIFHNYYVKDSLNFKDKIPFTFRGAGVHETFFKQQKIKPEYDFVYHGSMVKHRKLDKFFKFFGEKMPSASLLLIGNPDNYLKKIISKYPNIVITGTIPYLQVASYIKKARIGLNLIPNIFPFSHQPSIKLLEYCALNMPVVSTQYQWVEDFEKKRKAKFYYLKDDYANFNLKQIDNFEFTTPDVSDLEWENVFKQAGIINFLPQA